MGFFSQWMCNISKMCSSSPFRIHTCINFCLWCATTLIPNSIMNEQLKVENHFLLFKPPNDSLKDLGSFWKAPVSTVKARLPRSGSTITAVKHKSKLIDSSLVPLLSVYRATNYLLQLFVPALLGWGLFVRYECMFCFFFQEILLSAVLRWNHLLYWCIIKRKNIPVSVGLDLLESRIFN